MDVKEWVKTPDGIRAIENQKVFCMNGQLWQGFKGTTFRVPEGQVTTEELLHVPDIDNTISQVWFRRRQSLEGRHARKIAEYDKRRSELRRERTAIRASIKEDKELGLPNSADDVDQLRRIDERLRRLTDLSKEEALLIARAQEEQTQPNATEAAPEEPAEPQRLKCELCGKESAPGKNPAAWLRGHMAGAHRNPKKVQGAKTMAASELHDALSRAKGSSGLQEAPAAEG